MINKRVGSKKIHLERKSDRKMTCKENLNHAEELIHQLVDLKILKEHEGKGIGFTSQFNRHSTKVCNRLDANPETQSFDISEGIDVY